MTSATAEGAQWQALHEELTELARGARGDWRFAVAGGDVVTSVGGAAAVPSASVIKVPLVVSALMAVGEGVADLDEPVEVPAERTGGSGVLLDLPSVRTLTLRETLRLCIVVSDNVATNMIIDRFGLPELGERFRALGLRDTVLQRRMMDTEAAAAGRENLTTATEMAVLLRRLVDHEVLPGHLTDVVLGLLGDQQFRDRIPARVPGTVWVGNKTGELPGVRHDVGILRSAGRTVTLAALGTNLPDAQGRDVRFAASGVISRAALATLRVLESAG